MKPATHMQLATQKKESALAILAQRFSVDPNKLLDTLKQTVFKGANNEELMTLVVVANQYGLNPLTKELYAFPAKGGGIVPVVSIDGWLRMMNDHPQFDGMDYEWEHDAAGKLVACTAVIYRKDRSKPVRVTEYLAECKRPTDPWKMEHRMLRHKATIQGARIAFGFSGITDEDEAAAISVTRDVTPASESKLFAGVDVKKLESAVAKIDFPVLLADYGLAWPDVARVCLDNGMIDDVVNDPSSLDDATVSDIVSQIDRIAEIVKGGAA